MSHTREYEIGETHVHELDARHLEEGLRLIAEHIREERDVVIVLTHYPEFRRTNHWIDYRLLGEILGVRLGLKEDLPMLLQQEHSLMPTTIHDIEAFVHGAVVETLHHAPNDYGDSLGDKVDRLLTNRWIGFPVLALVLGLVFKLTFMLGDPIGDWLDEGVLLLHDWLYTIIPDGWTQSLLADGIVLGVGSLATALPNIVILFFMLSIMEESGYMERVAYLMDGLLHRLGLHGRSFIPMLMGFDCNVPAIMAAKDIHDPKERSLTMLMVPYMSCSARLPVYILFISVFFHDSKALVLASLYAMGVVCSFMFALIMKNTRWFYSPQDDHVNELPAFRMPTARAIAGHIWFRASDFLKKISTVVLCASVIIWALEYFPAQNLEHLEDSYLAVVGHWIEPLMQPLGFDWRLSVCLLTGIPAKEAIAATFAILYGNDIAGMGLTAATAYGFLVFTLLYFPCIATVATLRKELGRKWALFSVFNSLVLAWVAAFAVQVIAYLIYG